MDEICRVLSALGITPVPLWPEGVWCEVDGTEIEIHTDSEHSFTYVTTSHPPGMSRYDLSPEGLNAANNEEPVSAHTRNGLRLSLVGTPTRETLQWALATIIKERNGSTTIPLPEVPPIEEQMNNVLDVCTELRWDYTAKGRVIQIPKAILAVFPHYVSLEVSAFVDERPIERSLELAKWVSEENLRIPLGYFLFEHYLRLIFGEARIPIPLTQKLVPDHFDVALTMAIDSVKRIASYNRK